jgi:putative transposase
MTRGLRRFHQSGHSHFLTFSCYHRQPYFSAPEIYHLFLACLEQTRRRFDLYVYGYVVMPEHVHLLVSEPKVETLADAMHFLKLSSAKRVHHGGPFWQKRYYDRNLREAEEFAEKLRYIHRNPMKPGLVEDASQWKWSSYRHYALREVGVVEIESEWTARDRETKPMGSPGRVFLSPG